MHTIKVRVTNTIKTYDCLIKPLRVNMVDTKAWNGSIDSMMFIQTATAKWCFRSTYIIFAFFYKIFF